LQITGRAAQASRIELTQPLTDLSSHSVTMNSFRA